MKIKNINLNRLVGGLEQMGQLESSNFHFNYAVGKNLNKLGTLVKSYNKSLLALINEHVQMDEKGTPMGDNQYIFKTTADKETYLKKKAKIDEIETEVDIWKLKTSELKTLKSVEVENKDGTKTKKFLSGNILFLLDEIIIDDAPILGGESEKNEQGNSVPKKSEIENNPAAN